MPPPVMFASVCYDGTSKIIDIDDGSLLPFLYRTLRAFGLAPSPIPSSPSFSSSSSVADSGVAFNHLPSAAEGVPMSCSSESLSFLHSLRTTSSSLSSSSPSSCSASLLSMSSPSPSPPPSPPASPRVSPVSSPHQSIPNSTTQIQPVHTIPMSRLSMPPSRTRSHITSLMTTLTSPTPAPTPSPTYVAPCSRTTGASDLQLAFQTSCGSSCAITTDLALRLALSAPSQTGRLILADAHDLPSIDDSVHSVLRAVADTAARREAAAMFVALSGAWERASREIGIGPSDQDSRPPCPSSPSPSRSSSVPHSISSLGSPSSSPLPSSGSPALAATHSFTSFPALPPPNSSSSSSSASGRYGSAIPGGEAPYPTVRQYQQQRQQRQHPHLQQERNVHAALTRALEEAVRTDTARSVVDAAVGGRGTEPCNYINHNNRNTNQDIFGGNGNQEDIMSGMAAMGSESSSGVNSESRALACFCTHTGVACSECHVQPITGTRYRRCNPNGATSSAAVAQRTHPTHILPSSAGGGQSVNLCERCKRALADDDLFGNDDATYVVYDHPWEASDEYAMMGGSGGGIHSVTIDETNANGHAHASGSPGAIIGNGSHSGSVESGSQISGSGSMNNSTGDGNGNGAALPSSATTSSSPTASGGSGCDSLKAPPPPLQQGDVGPRVLHLHYVLYKVGYLSVARPWFRPGVFCAGTSEAVGKLQSEHWVAGMSGQLGVYSAVTRTVILSLLDEQERRAAQYRCSAIGSNADAGPRLRMALAA